MRLVVGLGNPGPRYADTRHNVGFRGAERFAGAQRISLDEERFGGVFGRAEIRLQPSGEPAPVTVDVGVLLPLTFMNLSGASVAAALRELPVEAPSRDLLVILDDVDLPFGRLRLRPAGGAGGHRGLTHVIEYLGHGDFPRLRFGVGRPPGGGETTDHVLAPFSREEEAALDEGLGRVARAVEVFLVDGLATAMNRFNRELPIED